MKFKEIQQLSKTDQEKKLKELKLELVKAKANAAKSGSSKAKQIRKIVARIHTFNNDKNKSELNKK